MIAQSDLARIVACFESFQIGKSVSDLPPPHLGVSVVFGADVVII